MHRGSVLAVTEVSWSFLIKLFEGGIMEVYPSLSRACPQVYSIV